MPLFLFGFETQKKGIYQFSLKSQNQLGVISLI